MTRPGNRPPAPRIAFLVHGGPGSVEAVRAREFAASLPPGSAEILLREGPKLALGLRWTRRLAELAPDAVYVLNTALPGAVVAPWSRRVRRLPYVLDTGDAVYEMARDSGVEPRWRLPFLRAVEQLAQRHADTVVVRGSRHQAHLREQGFPRVELIRDGYVDPGPVPPQSVADLRRRLGLPEAAFVVGVLGSTVFSPRLRICYGWDLIGALARLRDLPVHGLVIGDGNGLPWLKEQAAAAGVAERMTFAGRIPYTDVQPALRLFDIALSTQTNNLAGQVRTTGKLPEYMAAGRFVLASRVGDAEVLLPEPMLVDFHGTVDAAYPERLAGRIRGIMANPTQLRLADTLPARARETCGYPILRERFRSLAERFNPSRSSAR